MHIPDAGMTSNINEGIKIDKENKFSLQNISDTYEVNGQYIFQLHNILNDYRDLLFSYLLEINIDEEDFFLPELTSKKFYGTSDLWYLILFCNGMYDKFKYINKKVKILNPSNLKIYNTIIEANRNRLKLAKASPRKIKTSTIYEIV